MKNLILTAGALVATLCFTAAPGGAQTWNFNSGDQGWIIHDLAGSGDYIDSIGTYSADFHAAGGNPGGYITGTDRSGGSFFFQAPEAALGNYSIYLGGKLSFSLTTDQSVDFTDDSVVLLRGSASNLTIVTNVMPFPNSGWTNYSLDLNAEQFHYNNLSGSAVSASDFSAILASLTDVSIDGEYHNGISETTGLDSVAFVPTNIGSGAVPEPSTYGLIGAISLAAAAFLRRKHTQVNVI